LVWPWQEHLRSGFVTKGILTCADNSSGIQVFPLRCPLATQPQPFFSF
jgi:hypothetical protein